MEDYYLKLKNEYLKKCEDINDTKSFMERFNRQTKKLLKDYGESSHNIDSFLRLWDREKISQSHFRELVRLEMDKNFRKKINDRINKYNSQLKEELNPKMSKVMNEERIKKLEIQINTLKTLL